MQSEEAISQEGRLKKLSEAASAIDLSLERLYDSEALGLGIALSCESVDAIIRDGLAEFPEKDWIAIMSMVVTLRMQRAKTDEFARSGGLSTLASFEAGED
ncbi:MAG: hypothetical protein EPN75_08780 [Beijerinckiaceae bacterium]|nr:MAG: hypothetical protein EPN75_08780 [Beijerinckiaceae bacterium]